MRQTAPRHARGSRGRWGTSDRDAPVCSLAGIDPAGADASGDDRVVPLRGRRTPAPARSPWLTVKHLVDADLAALLLLLLSPLLLLLAVAVKLSSRGPVLFRQERVGEGGRTFEMVKFRSMRPAGTVVPFEPLPGLAPGGVEGDDRRTPVGRLIRALSLDELPQLVNVLRGEMSIVGPRPERPEFVELFSRELREYPRRHVLRPGITGWAQVHGYRGATSIERRLDLDLEYVDRWSPVFDVKVMALTVMVVLGVHRPGPDEPDTEAVLVGSPVPLRRHGVREAEAPATAQAMGSGSSIES